MGSQETSVFPTERDLIAAAGQAIFLVDAAGRFAVFNPAAERLTGYSASELLGRARADVLFDAASVGDGGFAALAELARTSPSGHFERECAFRRRDGATVDVMLTISALRSPDQVPQGNLCQATDLSTQHRAMRQLGHEREALERVARSGVLSEVLESLVLGHEALFPGTLGSVLLLDESGTRLQVGAAPSVPAEYTRSIHGLSILTGEGSCGAAALHATTVIVPDVAVDPRWTRFAGLAMGHGLRACWSTPILSAQGRVLGTFALYYREPRSPEAHELAAIQSSARIAGLAIERHKAEAELRSFAERLELATRSAQMGIFDYDVAHNRLVWDEQMLRIFGVRREEFVGHYDDWRERVHPDDLEAAEASVTAAVEGHKPFGTSFRILRPDGELRFIEAVAILQRDAAGRATRMTGVNIDVTEKKQLEAQLLRSQRLESVGRLAGGIAHDLNNILAPMLIGPAMLREVCTDPERSSVLDMIESNAQRAANIIRQLLTFSRGGESPRALLDPRVVMGDMAHLIRETFPRNIRLSYDADPQVSTVIGDATQLHQVMMNLCVNARDEMPAGGVLELSLGDVIVGSEQARRHPSIAPGRYVRLCVRDEGRGIDPAHMDKLFDPFFTTKGVGQGTGLGLATVLGIVKGHGGFIEVHSRLGHGATFEVFLPASDPALASAGQEIRGLPPRGAGQRILLVDDEEAIRRVTRAMLIRAGYDVSVAHGGEAALALLRSNGQDVRLVLTDLLMPDMDGDSLVRAIRDLPKPMSDVPIVTMSGNPGAVQTSPRPHAPVDARLQKPFTMIALLETLHAALARAQLKDRS